MIEQIFQLLKWQPRTTTQEGSSLGFMSMGPMMGPWDQVETLNSLSVVSTGFTITSRCVGLDATFVVAQSFQDGAKIKFFTRCAFKNTARISTRRRAFWDI